MQVVLMKRFWQQHQKFRIFTNYLLIKNPLKFFGGFFNIWKCFR